LDSSGSGSGPRTGCSKLGNEPLAYMKDGNYFNQLIDNHLVKEDSAPWSSEMTSNIHLIIE